MASCSGTLTVSGDGDGGDGGDGGGGGGGGFDPTDVTVSCGIDSSEVTEGNGVRMTVTLANANAESASISVATTASGQTINTESLTLNGGETLTFQAMVGHDLSPGSYSIETQVTSATQASAFGLSKQNQSEKAVADGGCSVCG